MKNPRSKKCYPLFCLAAAVCILIGLFASTAIPVSAATVKLNRKKIYLYNGEVYKLKLKNSIGKVKFSSKDTSIATVSSKGLVTAVSEGTTTIKVKNAGNTYKCKVIVMGEEPDIDDPGVPGDTDDPRDDQAVYDAIIALKKKYPEGTSWTNANSYSWGSDVAMGLGYSNFGGMGCQAFAMMASDAAFGDVPVYKFTDKKQIKVGDILRINNDTHSVIVLEINGKNITIAEGNYNSSVHWGRVIDIDNCGFVYGYTRYNNE